MVRSAVRWAGAGVLLLAQGDSGFVCPLRAAPWLFLWSPKAPVRGFSGRRDRSPRQLGNQRTPELFPEPRAIFIFGRDQNPGKVALLLCLMFTGVCEIVVESLVKSYCRIGRKSCQNEGLSFVLVSGDFFRFHV